MKKVAFTLLALLVVGALAIEVVAPRLAATAIEDRVQERTAEQLAVSADIGPFPVVTRLLATSRVPRLRVTLDEVAGQQLTFASVRFDLLGVELDREALLGGDVLVRGMQSGRVTATFDAGALAEAIGAPVQVEGGNLVAEVAGTRLELPLVLEGRALRLPGGLPAITLPDVVPCAPTETAFRDGVVELTCELEEVPEILS